MWNTLNKVLILELAAIGVVVVEQDESYASKANALALDPLSTYKEGDKHIFSGRRKKRGLYQSLTDQVEDLVRIKDTILSLDMRAPLSFFIN